MTLSNLQLEAFRELAKTRSFSLAAKNVHITQSALSQRIAQLEQAVSATLMIRHPTGIILTPTGQQLLQYCQVQQQLELEFLNALVPSDSSLRGSIRIAGMSSVMKSVILPCLAETLQQNSSARLEILNREIGELEALLDQNITDYIITSQPTHDPRKTSLKIGEEENYLVENSKIKTQRDVFLDHDKDDVTTILYFQKNAKKVNLNKRHFVDEVYGLIAGVELGLGRAVVPYHLIASNKKISRVRGFKPLKIPIFLQFRSQDYPSKLHDEIVGSITANTKKHLIAKG